MNLKFWNLATNKVFHKAKVCLQVRQELGKPFSALAVSRFHSHGRKGIVSMDIHSSPEQVEILLQFLIRKNGGGGLQTCQVKGLT